MRPLRGRGLLALVSGAAVSVASLGVSGCGSMMANATEAQVRFVDTSVDAPPLDVYLNGTGAAYNLSFATFSSYLPMGSGAVQVSANRAGTAQALATGRATLVSGHQYTAVVGNRLGDLQEHIYTDNLPATVAGTIALRVLNEVEGSALDVYFVTGTGLLASSLPVVTNLGYGANAGYVRVPAGGSFAVYAAPAGSSPMAAGVMKMSGANVSGAAGTAHTLILAEAATKESRGLYGIVLDDAETP